MLNADKRVLQAITELLEEGREPIIYDQIAACAIVSKNTVMKSVARLCAAGALIVARPDTASPYRYRIPGRDEPGTAQPDETR